jgi:iron-sulfur cluster assembly protein
MNIKLTDDAAQEVKRLRTDDAPYLRLEIQGGGCSGFSYKLKFDNKTTDDDVKINDHDITVVVDRKSSLFLDGTTLDFVTHNMMAGFVFENPNAVKSCGCGSSFGV